MRKFFISIITISLILATTLASPFASAVVFTDVTSSHPNFNAINYLHEQGVIEGYGDNTFRPEQFVNRVEALKIILLGSDVFVPELQEQEIFPDVMYGTWYDKYVAKAKNLGIVKGDDGTGLFRPGDTINLAEALKILLKTGNKEHITPPADPYLDVPAGAWFGPYFEYARLAGLLDQSQNENVYPATPVTRGLLAELMYRLATSNLVVPDGKASYYGEKFHGRTTASGEIFDASDYTAAHRTLPFGTRVKVTNAENGKSIVVRINDRGPYAGEDRIIDLSKAAFEVISPLSRGVIPVKVEETLNPVYTPPPEGSEDGSDGSLTVTDGPNGGAADEPTAVDAPDLNATKTDCPEAANLFYLPKNTFQGIALSSDVPNRFLLDEVLTLTGTTTANTDTVSAFLLDSSNNQTSFEGSVTSGSFEIYVRFPAEGTFKLGVLPGIEGQSIVKEIKVLSNSCIAEAEDGSIAPTSFIELDLERDGTKISWDPGGSNLFKLTFSQGGNQKSYILKSLDKWIPVYRDFADFHEGEVQLSLRSGTLAQRSILEPAQIQWSPAATKTFIADTHNEYFMNEDEVELVSISKNTIVGNTIQLIFKPKIALRKIAAVILPTGWVREIELTSSTLTAVENEFGVEVFPPSSSILTASYTAKSTGVHFLEVNNENGLAAINIPIYIKNQFPLLPNIRDLSGHLPENLGSDLVSLQSQMLSLLNKDRNTYGLPPLALDNNLSRLAQGRSDDMVFNNYFGHWDLQGRDANDIRMNYGIQTLVGENLAKDINLELAQYGLMQSAIHRSNILSDEWTRVGFGVSRHTDGSYFFVQIFSTDPLDMDDLDTLRAEVLAAANKNRITDLAMQNNLNSLAQSWSEKMVTEDFFDFVDGSGVSLVDTIHDAGVTAALGTYIMGNSSFGDALLQLEQNIQVQQSNWVNLGIGIKQDNLGIIKITLIYTE